ncbi:MAG: DUF2809 domain-containing protein [Acidobacteria bacterium]|nr:DUF2809 domain-containing protein [Acidobacteriota bacterium]
MRSRARLAALAAVTIALGLASRRYASQLPGVVAAYAGDVLWAALVYWLVAWCAPGRPARGVGAVALLLAGLVECSQALHTPWLDGFRAHRLVALVLGQGFLWSDLLCYAAGVTVALTLDVTRAPSP